MLETKITTTEMKNAFDGPFSSWERAEERAGEPGNRSTETSPNAKQREKEN